jgi:hypothetical protein
MKQNVSTFEASKRLNCKPKLLQRALWDGRIIAKRSPYRVGYIYNDEDIKQTTRLFRRNIKHGSNENKENEIGSQK